MGKQYFTAEEFVREYMKAHKLGLSLHDLAARNEVQYSTVYSRWKSLLKRGVKLPELGKQRKSVIDVDELNAIIKKGEY